MRARADRHMQDRAARSMQDLAALCTQDLVVRYMQAQVAQDTPARAGLPMRDQVVLVTRVPAELAKPRMKQTYSARQVANP
jgi:hypothetical protein